MRAIHRHALVALHDVGCDQHLLAFHGDDLTPCADLFAAFERHARKFVGPACIHHEDLVAFLCAQQHDTIREVTALALFERAGSYDVLVSFAQHDSGQFLANVNVELTRAHEDQPALSMQAVGPYLIAQLPEGRYELTATAPGWESSSYDIEVRPYHRERVYVTLQKIPQSAPELSQR